MEKQASKVLLYGANGYTGRLICRVMAEQGMTPVLAGRSREAIAPMADLYGWEARIFPLDGPEHIAPNLQDIKVVLHAAGPFRDTAAAMMQACMATQTHYLDITGEIEVFALAHKWDAAAKQAGVMLMPGTGFDVVPTDCMALLLKENMPDATQLELAFVTLGGQISHGTAMSMAGKLGEGGGKPPKRKTGKGTPGQKGPYHCGRRKIFFCNEHSVGRCFYSIYYYRHSLY